MTRQPPDMHSQNTLRRVGTGAAGYSIAVVICSLQLMIVAGLIAVPKLGTYLTQYRLLSASTQLGFDINRARMQAVGQNRYVRIKFQNSSTQYQRQWSWDGSSWTTDRTTTLPSGITASPADGTIQFDKRGMATANSTITMTNAVPKTKVITTNVLGRVTVTNG